MINSSTVYWLLVRDACSHLRQMNAIVCYCKPERKSEQERNERISSISILLWCWLHFVRNGALMEDKRPVFMTCSPCAHRSPAGRDCHLWAGAQSHISAFITLLFSLSQPHTHNPPVLHEALKHNTVDTL